MTVVAGAGFGKSTLLAAWVARVQAAWYSLQPEDASLPNLLRGLVDALRLRLPNLPDELGTALASSLGPMPRTWLLPTASRLRSARRWSFS